jgi:hypothetical protein
MTGLGRIIRTTAVLLAVLYTPAELLAFKPDTLSGNTTPISQAAQMLSRYIAIPSVSGSENEAAYFLAGKCEEAGLHVHFITDNPGSVNFAASLSTHYLLANQISFFRIT